MIGTLTVNGESIDILEATLHLPLFDESRWMYLVVYAEEDSGFGMCDVDFQALQETDDLHGKRMHVKPNYETYEDDTLGTDIVSMYWTTDINYLRMKGQNYAYGDIQLDFERIEGKKYRCYFSATLTDDLEHELRELPSSAFGGSADAEFIVTVNERDPSEE